MSSSKLALHKGVTLSGLLAFREVAEKGGIAAAFPGDASRQALVSRQIALLEQWLGAPVKEREGRQLRPSQTGHRIAALIREFERGLSDIAGDENGKPISYRIAASNTAINYLILPSVADLRGRAPWARLEIDHCENRETAELCRSGEYDLGIVAGSRPPAPLRSAKLGNVRYTLAVPAKLHAGRPMARILSDVPLCLPVGGSMRRALDAWAAKQQLTLKAELTVTSHEHAARAVACGEHAAILPSITCVRSEDTVLLPLPREIAPAITWWLVWSARTESMRAKASAFFEACKHSWTARLREH